MLDGVTISESKNQKDELILEGTDIQNVSQSGKYPCSSWVCATSNTTFLRSRVHPGHLPCTEQGYP